MGRIKVQVPGGNFRSIKTGGSTVTNTTIVQATAPAITQAVPSFAAGGITSVSGTASRITAATVSGAVTIDIDAAYVGQTSITTLGTITTGTWNGTAIANANLAHSSVTITAGTGMSGGGAVSLGNSVTLTNAGVTSCVAGSGISVSGATGAVTITNTSSSGVGATVANRATSASLTSSGVTMTTLVLPAAGTWLINLTCYASASTATTLSITASVSSGTITAETGGVFRVVNASNTVDTYSVNMLASGAKSIFSSTTQTMDGWGIVVTSAAATLTITGTASSGNTITCGYISAIATRLA